jgi:hypothetical protein
MRLPVDNFFYLSCFQSPNYCPTIVFSVAKLLPNYRVFSRQNHLNYRVFSRQNTKKPLFLNAFSLRKQRMKTTHENNVLSRKSQRYKDLQKGEGNRPITLL